MRLTAWAAMNSSFAFIVSPPIARKKRSHGVVAQIIDRANDSLSRYLSGDGLDLGPAEGREAVHYGDADLD
ncbi:hypothetical protein JMM63_07825, partial [Rhodovulum sulfidophilum]|uniref:hypothetical protein n=1 Tax=Rhodovulum sulfidophilum TaxID=35806 RepID=UPI001920ACE8